MSFCFFDWFWEIDEVWAGCISDPIDSWGLILNSEATFNSSSEVFLESCWVAIAAFVQLPSLFYPSICSKTYLFYIALSYDCYSLKTKPCDIIWDLSCAVIFCDDGALQSDSWSLLADTFSRVVYFSLSFFLALFEAISIWNLLPGIALVTILPLRFVEQRDDCIFDSWWIKSSVCSMLD